MADFTWEFGIDWAAVQAVGGLSYLRGVLISQGALAMARMNEDDTITFRIFDVTDAATTPAVHTIESFVINTSPAILRSLDAGIPFSSLQPRFLRTPDSPRATSTAFPNALRSWSSQPMQSPLPPQVTVTVPKGRFLLNFQTEALGEDKTTRTFFHDPEMVVGSSM